MLWDRNYTLAIDICVHRQTWWQTSYSVTTCWKPSKIWQIPIGSRPKSTVITSTKKTKRSRDYGSYNNRQTRRFKKDNSWSTTIASSTRRKEQRKTVKRNNNWNKNYSGKTYLWNTTGRQAKMVFIWMKENNFRYKNLWFKSHGSTLSYWVCRTPTANISC